MNGLMIHGGNANTATMSSRVLGFHRLDDDEERP
jgi:hypothetical protein